MLNNSKSDITWRDVLLVTGRVSAPDVQLDAGHDLQAERHHR